MSWVIIEAPSVLGLTPSGVEDLPRALRAAALDTRLGIKRAVRVEPLPYDSRRDAETGMLNTIALVDYTHRLANEVTAAFECGERPLVLGGDCSILLGNLLALARRGRYGLFFVDGHADFYQVEANINGQAASSELAFATGRGPGVLTRFDDHFPLIRDESVVALGIRDAAEAAAYADVLDDAVMPAVDYRLVDTEAGRLLARRLVAQIFTSWNPLMSWMRGIRVFQSAA